MKVIKRKKLAVALIQAMGAGVALGVVTTAKSGARQAHFEDEEEGV